MQRNLLSQREIQIPEIRSNHRIAAKISKRRHRPNQERAGIEPRTRRLNLRRTNKSRICQDTSGSERIAHQVRTVGVGDVDATALALVEPARHRKWLPRLQGEN